MSHFIRLLCVCLVAGCDGGSSSGGFAGTLISITTTSATIGTQGRLRVTFDNPLASDTNVMLTSSTPAVGTIADHVTVPKGAISAEAQWTGVALGNTTFYATAGAATQQSSASVVDHFTVNSVSTDSTLEKGALTTFYAYLNAVTPAAVQVDTAAGDATIVSLADHVTVSPWSSTGRTTMSALTVGNTTVTAKVGDEEVSTVVNVVDHARLARNSSIGAQVVEVGGVIVSSVSVDAIVASPTTITVTSSDPTVAAAPANVVIPTGSRTAQLRIPVTGAGQTTFTFTLADSTFDVPITGVAALHLISMSINTPLAVGNQSNGTLSLDAIAGAPHAIALSSSDPTILAVPAEVTIPTGGASTSFVASALKSGTVTVTASYGGSSIPAVVYVSDPSTASAINIYWYQPKRLLPGATAQLQIYSTASQIQLTSSDPTVISVPPALSVPSYGYVYPFLTALKTGAVTLTVSAGGISSKLDLEVVSAPDLQIGPTFNVAPGMSMAGNVDLGVVAPTGTYLTFTSSNPAVLAAPAPVTLGSTTTSASFQLMGLATGTAIVTVTCMGVSRSAAVYVGQATPEPVFLNNIDVTDSAIEKGAATIARLFFTNNALTDIPITLTASPAPNVTIADSKPVLPLGDSLAFVPITGKVAGTVMITAVAGGVTRTVNFNILDKPTFSIVLSGSVGVNSAVEGSIQSDCRLAADHQVSLSSGDTNIATVTPATVVVSPSSGSAQFAVKGVAAGMTVINFAPSPLPSPSPMPASITVF